VEKFLDVTEGCKHVIFVTGSGLSAASGARGGAWMSACGRGARCLCVWKGEW